MNDDILRKITQHFDSPAQTYSKGTILTHAYQQPKGVALLVSGVVEQYDITPEGNKITLNVFKPRAFFPMSWAINKTPNEYFFAALSDVTVRYADADKTVEFLRDNPDVLFDLLSRVYKGTDGLQRRLVLAARGVASSRLIFELLLEAYRFGGDVDAERKIIKVKQSNLAARSGLARETVSRELHKLENEQLVSITKQGIVLDLARLEARLEIDI